MNALFLIAVIVGQNNDFLEDMSWRLRDSESKIVRIKALVQVSRQKYPPEPLLLRVCQILEQTDDDDLRATALNAIAAYGVRGRRAEGLVSSYAQQKHSTYVRYAALQAMVRIGVRRSTLFSELIAGVKDDSPIVRSGALQAMAAGRFNDSEAEAVYVAALNDMDADVCNAAIYCVRELGLSSDDVVTALIRLLSDRRSYRMWVSDHFATVEPIAAKAAKCLGNLRVNDKRSNDALELASRTATPTARIEAAHALMWIQGNDLALRRVVHQLGPRGDPDMQHDMTFFLIDRMESLGGEWSGAFDVIARLAVSDSVALLPFDEQGEKLPMISRLIGSWPIEFDDSKRSARHFRIALRWLVLTGSPAEQRRARTLLDNIDD